MAAMAMAYTFAPATSSSVTIFDDGGGAITQLALPLLCLIAALTLAVGCDFSRAYLPVVDQAKRLLGGVLGRHPRDGRPPPRGNVTTPVWTQSQTVHGKCSVRVYAHGHQAG
jgi:hypothetical protein